jgi:hypothetical protein
MIYGGSVLLPLRNGYTPEIPYSVDITVLPGGPSSQRRVTATPISSVTAQYRLTSCFMIEWYKAWYRRETLEGALPLTARLAVDNGLFADYTVQFAAPPTIQHFGYQGLLTCRYEILNRNTSADNCDYLVLYDALGNCVSCSLETLRDGL